MKAEDMRRRLQEMSAEELQVVAAQLYRMLPKKVAEEAVGFAPRSGHHPATMLKTVEAR